MSKKHLLVLVNNFLFSPCTYVYVYVYIYVYIYIYIHYLCSNEVTGKSDLLGQHNTKYRYVKIIYGIVKIITK